MRVLELLRLTFLGIGLLCGLSIIVYYQFLGQGRMFLVLLLGVVNLMIALLIHTLINILLKGGIIR